jgi:hypothetical protein
MSKMNSTRIIYLIGKIMKLDDGTTKADPLRSAQEAEAGYVRAWEHNG